MLTLGPLHRDEGAESLLAGLEGLAPFDVVTVILPRGDADLVERALRLETEWPRIDATWWPRLEDRSTIAFAGDRLRLSGRFDLLVGGMPTPCERVIVVTCSSSVRRARKTGRILKKLESIRTIGYQV